MSGLRRRRSSITAQNLSNMHSPRCSTHAQRSMSAISTISGWSQSPVETGDDSYRCSSNGRYQSKTPSIDSLRPSDHRVTAACMSVHRICCFLTKRLEEKSVSHSPFELRKRARKTEWKMRFPRSEPLFIRRKAAVFDLRKEYQYTLFRPLQRGFRSGMTEWYCCS